MICLIIDNFSGIPAFNIAVALDALKLWMSCVHNISSNTRMQAVEV